MARRNRECYLCGTDYKYCPTCSEDKMKPSWMAEFHSEDCVKIFAICTDFNMDKMSKTEAQSALNKCDLSNRLNFRPCIQRDLDVIFAEDSIAVTLDAEIKEVHEDKVVVETSMRGNNKKKSHEVVINKENE